MDHKHFFKKLSNELLPQEDENHLETEEIPTLQEIIDSVLDELEEDSSI